ncbi:hypothetical protein RSOLAG1IB_12085 [Rhizoctonia solani AG-1 IB]|uniref:Uncharacterized protein n=1 Tax=Thanatephorus cucumeris (strain AG1-IB / isolate 7/3/14) TaxID=1108050 RepID=A0A0B7FHU0_THACB|nr:hypothetical protein RSOLAG1IB_12085 [Rhizoctonia solani AG-1 IB]
MSLSCNLNLLNSALAWSKGVKNGPVVIDFPAGWSTRIGTVFTWYRAQKCTRFLTLKHCAETTAPFFHQFLLVKLTDGSVCRFERTGDPGARTNALSSIGSTAHDLVQTFDAEPLAMLRDQIPINEFSSITFSREFDLLDILAICYAVHQGDRTRHYTLQRFNCYFFCWTIITILTRRVAPWRGLSDDSWDSVTHTTISSIGRRSSTSPLVPANQPPIIRAFSILEPENPSSINFLLDRLREELRKDVSRDHVNQQLEKVLWRYSWDKTKLRDALFSHIKDVALMVSESNLNSPAYVLIRSAMETTQYALDSWASDLYEKERRILIARQFEHELRTELKEKGSHRSILGRLRTIKSRCYLLYVKFAGRRGLISFKEGQRHENEELGVEYDAVMRVLDAMDEEDRRDPDNILSLLREAARVDKSQEDYWQIWEEWKALWCKWVWHMVQEELGDNTWKSLQDEARTTEQSLRVVINKQDIASIGVKEHQRTITSVFEFQEHIRLMIHHHAHLVGNLGLGSETQVRNDIEVAISQTWELVPSDHRN